VETFSTDGTPVHADDQGIGPMTVMIIGPGMDDGTSRTNKLMRILARRFRVLRLHRRQYRLDLKTDGTPFCVTQEADDVLAIAKLIDQPVLIYGHSSGGTVALEALVAAPAAVAGAVIFEPATAIGTPWAGPNGELIAQARGAIARNRPGAAMALFARQVSALPAWQARLVGVLTACVPRYRRLVPCQIDDLAAMDQLGDRREAYARITTPILLLGGQRSPTRNLDVLQALARTVPQSEEVVMPGLNHGADVRAPMAVARAIETFADKILAASDHDGRK
jgi:pimeloyl-ACP methyl ester carboxylesterase